MNQVEKEIEEQSRHLTKLYFEDRDYEGIIAYLADEITWIGTGMNEICLSLKDAYHFFEKEQEVYAGTFTIRDTWYQAAQISDDVCYVMVVIRVEANEETPIVPDGSLRFSGVWKKIDDGWKLVHVHNSVVEASGVNDSYFNMDISDSKYSMIKEQILKITDVDPLTGIKNTQGFEHEAEKLFNENPDQRYALVKFGVRNFRFINRRFSYKTGDKVLKDIADNLMRVMESDEACARIEKDVFAMLLKYEGHEAMDIRMAQIREQLISLDLQKTLDMEIHLRAGIYCVDNNQKEFIKDMLDKALMAMLSNADTRRGSQYAYYEDWMMNQQYQNSKILEDAPKAMDNDEFMLYIQPQFDIQTRKIVSGEALTRWRLCDGSVRTPDEFIPVFEKYGMIMTFDFHMLEKTCQKMREWLDQGITLAPISINQSRLHIEEENYLKDFCAVVDRYKIPHEYISFELTESAFVENSKMMIHLSNRLHKEGFQLAIDDFGTGYASMNLLSIVSADILKIDKSLLNDYDTNSRSAIILQKIIELAHQMDMVVICEGIETKEQLDFLRTLHCDIGQGFLIGKPIEADKFVEVWKDSLQITEG